ncbi:uncharacterized protein EHS24_000898 [Apiotrichum porosum]|uniref:Transcriptional regulatory protein n=1 Tax=Apiotrichum porosum TaxID=105984 RepID=A0A427YB35_9TREE|nr:uncharacterized protein EHS24_000898 [Apiotrichum porosum]RSH88359.1 hypothetical protein EHS24_000898 [Apiotrichum porosum]
MAIRGLTHAASLASAVHAGPSCRMAALRSRSGWAGTFIASQNVVSSIPTFGTTSRSFTTSPTATSGHSRWSKIRHKKGAVDSARGAFYSRVMAEVHTALRPPNSPDPLLNPRLAAALTKAKEAGLPKALVESAFARAKKLADGTGKAVTFEATGAGGKVAMIIECVTENPARTNSKVKEALSKSGSKASNVGFLFERKGRIWLEPIEGNEAATFDSLFDVAAEGGAEDVREVEADDEGMVWEVITAPNDLGSLTSLLTSAPHDAAYSLRSSELAYVATDPVVVGEEGGVDEDQAQNIGKTIDALEEEPDVVKVWTNME